MSTEQASEHPSPANLSSASGSMVEIKPDPTVTAAMQTAVDALLQRVQQDADAIATVREQIQNDKGLIDDQVGSAREAIASIHQQLEASRSAATEISNFATSIQASNQQSKDTAAQAAAALESARAHAEAAGKSVAAIESLKVQVEQTAQVAATRSDHIENGRKHADGVRAAIDKIVTQAQQQHLARHRGAPG